VDFTPASQQKAIARQSLIKPMDKLRDARIGARAFRGIGFRTGCRAGVALPLRLTTFYSRQQNANI